MENKNPIFFLDIDGVLATSFQFNTNRKNYHPVHNCYRFDKKCVGVMNDIIEQTNCDIVLSSDWKLHYIRQDMREIFAWNGLKCNLIGVTPRLPVEYYTLQLLAEQRALEILKYVEDHDITNYVAVDDLPLLNWLPDNFVQCTKIREGIKQSGIKDKILKILLSNL